MSTEPLKIATPQDLDSNEPPPLEQARWRFLCEGDSWFTLGDLNPFASANLLQHLRFSEMCWAVNCATPGDTLSRMVDMNADPHLRSLLANSPRPVVRRWDAILLSAGGNDLIDAIGTPPARRDGSPIAQDRRLLRTPAEWGPPSDGVARYLSPAGWQRFADYLRANLRALVALRDSAGSQSNGVPIFMHTYALATPRNAGAGAGLGPWLFPALVRFGVPVDEWPRLGAHLQRQLARLLGDCAADAAAFPNLRVFESLDGLDIVPATPGAAGNSGDWSNEIHLNADGCAKFGAAWSTRIEAAMPA